MLPLVYSAFAILALLPFFLRPARGMAVFFVALCFFPQTFTLTIGTLGFPCSRVVIISLLVRLVLKRGVWRQLKLDAIDILVLLCFLGRLAALSRNVAPDVFLIREIGNFGFDLILPYIAARMAIHSTSDILSLFRSVLVMAVPLAVLGVYETVTGHSPVDMLVGSWQRDVRYGFYRACGTFSIHILWGLFFAALAPIGLAFLGRRPYFPGVSVALVVCSLFGLMSSVSSAPVFSVVISSCFLAGYRLRKHWRVLAVLAVCCAVFLEFYSNRHFYEVPMRLAFSSRTAYYRVGLINEAFGGGMDGHWLAGYGYVGQGPGNDNSNFHWYHTDMVNIYIAMLVRTGLLGVLPYLALNFLYYRRLYTSAGLARSRADMWFIWCFSASLVGWNMAMMTVAAFRQVNTILYILIAICVNLPQILSREAEISDRATGHDDQHGLSAALQMD